MPPPPPPARLVPPPAALRLAELFQSNMPLTAAHELFPMDGKPFLATSNIDRKIVIFRTFVIANMAIFGYAVRRKSGVRPNLIFNSGVKELTR